MSRARGLQRRLSGEPLHEPEPLFRVSLALRAEYFADRPHLRLASTDRPGDDPVEELARGRGVARRVVCVVDHDPAALTCGAELQPSLALHVPIDDPDP